MAEGTGNIESLDIQVTTAIDAAFKDIEKVTSGLDDMNKSMRGLASVAKSMGMNHVAKGIEGLQKAINATKLSDFQKQLRDVGESLAENGHEGFANAFKAMAAPDFEAQAAAAAENAKERAAIQKQEAKEVAAAQARYKKIAAESEKAYTRIVNEEAAKRASAEKQAAKETADAARFMEEQERLFRQINQAGALQAAKQKIAAAKEAAKAQAAAAKEAARVQKEEAKKATAAARQAAKEAAEAAKEAEARLANAKQSVSKLGGAFDAPFKKITAFFKAIGRIALYRAIRTAIKNISAAVREGLTNLETYSRTVGTAFAPAVDNLRQHVLLLKNAFATALRPVIEALIPIIIRLVDWLSRAADFVAQVMSVLTGKVDDNGRYTKAVLSDIQQSNKQAKELRRTLLGFDEINRLDGDTGSGESTSGGLQFTQAEVSEKAREVAEKIAKWVEKIKDFINGIDWATVLKVLAVIAAVVAGIKLFEKLKKVWDVLKSIGTVLKTVVGHISPIGAAVLIVIAIFALWGDKIAAWCRKAKKDIKDFFKSLKTDSKFFNALGELIGDVFGLALDIIADLAEAVYKLVHGDFKGAWEALKRLFADIILGVAKIIDGILNIIIGAAADIWNFALVPLINGIATVFAKCDVFFTNLWIDIKIWFYTAIAWIVDQLNVLLAKIEGMINKAIEAYNTLTGSKVNPISLQIDSTKVDQKIEELRKTKLPPITETVQLAGKWNAPKVTLATDLANKALDALGLKVNKIGQALTSVGSALSVMNGRESRSPFAIQLYASGGFPTVGSLFLAGERGAEYVGDIGGRTGVMNTDQMADAMYSAMVSALANAPQSGGDIYLDGEIIYKNVVRRNNNQVRSTGRAALLT